MSYFFGEKIYDVLFRDTISGACYPHVNMCVPITTIKQILRQYLNTGGRYFIRYELFLICCLQQGLNVYLNKSQVGTM